MRCAAVQGAGAAGAGAAGERAAFSEGQRVRARILFVDPASKRVGLSLLPHLLAADARAVALPPVGTVYEARARLGLDSRYRGRGRVWYGGVAKCVPGCPSQGRCREW